MELRGRPFRDLASDLSYDPHHHEDHDHLHTIFDAAEGVTKVLGPRRVANTLPTDKP